MHPIYDEVTNRIIAELETGAAPWTRPWRYGKANGIMPHNGVTGRPYSGINILVLWAAREARGYQTPNWMTYKQATEGGGQVRKGEKATMVVFTKKLRVKDEDEEKTVSMLRTYFVFNADQVDGLATFESQEIKVSNVPEFVKATGAKIEHGGNMAAYIPSKDMIVMPEERLFVSEASYQATLCHECLHWSGAKHRLNRDLSGRFGTQAYAAEELIAELGAAFLCAHLGIQGELRHAGYIENWLKLLRSDRRAIFTAASHASKAADYLRSFSVEVHEAA